MIEWSEPVVTNVVSATIDVKYDPISDKFIMFRV